MSKDWLPRHRVRPVWTDGKTDNTADPDSFRRSQAALPRRQLRSVRFSVTFCRDCVEQSSAGVAVTAEENRATNGNGETELQIRGGSSTPWPDSDAQHLDLRGSREPATDTLGGDIRLHEGYRLVALLEACGSQRRVSCQSRQLPGQAAGRRLRQVRPSDNRNDRGDPLSGHRAASSLPRNDVAHRAASSPVDPPPMGPRRPVSKSRHRRSARCPQPGIRAHDGRLRPLDHQLRGPRRAGLHDRCRHAKAPSEHGEDDESARIGLRGRPGAQHPGQRRIRSCGA